MGKAFELTFIDIFKNASFGDYCIGIMMWFMLLIVVGIVLYGILYIADSAFMPELEGKGNIYDKTFVPAHTTTSFMKVGNSNIPIITRHPDAFYVNIDIDGRKDSFGVSKMYYQNVQLGTIVKCKYNLGRLLTTSLYINEMCQ